MDNPYLSLKNNLTIVLLILILPMLYSCEKAKKDLIPTPLKALEISDYKTIRTVVTFTISYDQSFIDKDFGILISTSPGLNFNQYDIIAQREINDKFSFWQKGLTPNTKYYARTYLFNSTDTVYSDEISFFTANQILYDNIILSAPNHGYPEMRAGENITFEPSNYPISNEILYLKSLEIYINNILYERPTFDYTEHPSFTYNTTPRLNAFPILFPCNYAAGTYTIKVVLDGIPSQELSLQLNAFLPYSNPSSIDIVDRTLVYGAETLTLQNFSIDDKRSTIGIAIDGKLISISGNDYIFQEYLQEFGKGQKQIKLIQECGELSLGTIEIL